MCPVFKGDCVVATARLWPRDFWLWVGRTSVRVWGVGLRARLSPATPRPPPPPPRHTGRGAGPAAPWSCAGGRGRCRATASPPPRSSRRSPPPPPAASAETSGSAGRADKGGHAGLRADQPLGWPLCIVPLLRLSAQLSSHPHPQDPAASARPRGLALPLGASCCPAAGLTPSPASAVSSAHTEPAPWCPIS